MVGKKSYISSNQKSFYSILWCITIPPIKLEKIRVWSIYFCKKWAFEAYFRWNIASLHPQHPHEHTHAKLWKMCIFSFSYYCSDELHARCEFPFNKVHLHLIIYLQTQTAHHISAIQIPSVLKNSTLTLKHAVTSLKINIFKTF